MRFYPSIRQKSDDHSHHCRKNEREYTEARSIKHNKSLEASKPIFSSSLLGLPDLVQYLLTEYSPSLCALVNPALVHKSIKFCTINVEEQHMTKPRSTTKKRLLGSPQII